MSDVWLTPQQIASLRLAGMASTDRRVRAWAQKNLAKMRNRLRGKGIEIALSSLPVEAQADYYARITRQAASGGESTGGVGSFPAPTGAAPASADGGLAGGGDVVLREDAGSTCAQIAGEGGAGTPAYVRQSRRTDRTASPAAANHCASAAPAACDAEPWQAAADLLASRPARVREEAMRRARACLAVKRLVDAGTPARMALAQAAAEAGVPAGTLARWWFGHGLTPGVADLPVAAWPAALAPRWGVQAQREARISGPAWDALLAAYLRPEKPSLAKCYREVAAQAAARGWTLPSYASVARRVERLDPSLVTLARDGRRAHEAMHPPLRRSVAHLAALQWVNADGHRLDVFVRLPERFGGGIGRVHLVAWQDIFSRKILAWRLTPTLNAYSVLLSFADLVAEYGIPEHALLDNGREFGAKLITGGAPWRFRFKAQADEMLGALPLLGVQVHWATPFHGQSKPIERAFRDLAEEISKDVRLAGAYTGNRPDAKPENYGSKAADWALLEQVADEAIRRHNAREGRRTETARGRSFDATFAESYARQTVTKLAASQRAMLLLAAAPVRVRADSLVIVCGNAYGLDPNWRLAGQRVVARFDPDDLKKPASIYTLDGRYVGEAQPRMVPFDEAAAAQADRRWKAAARRADRERLKYLEQVERVAAPAPQHGPAPRPAATRLFVPPAPAARQHDEAHEQLMAKTDALILEMARRMAG